jgi:hypothetical protein
MKPMQIKAYVFSILDVVTFSSCLKDKTNDDRIIIDYPTYGYLTVWKEMDSKTGTANWETISNGNTLSVFSNYADSVRPRSGAYFYNPANADFNIDTSGYFAQKDSVIRFFSTADKDTTAFDYQIYGDSLLVLRNPLSIPARQIRYKKNNAH